MTIKTTEVGAMNTEDRDNKEAHFWKHTKRNGACIESTFKPQRLGYVHFFNGAKSVLAHRYAYSISKGPIPKGMFVCHRCDNRKCVNPRHLWLGTHADNMRDRNKKGRTASLKNGKHGCHNRRFTDEQVTEMRRRLNAGETRRAVAKAFGASSRYMSEIALGQKRVRAGDDRLLGSDDDLCGYAWETIRSLVAAGKLTRHGTIRRPRVSECELRALRAGLAALVEGSKP